MISVVALTVAMSSGSFISDIPRSASLLNQAPPPIPAAEPIVSFTQFDDQVAELEESKPSIVPPIILLVGGGLVAIGGAYVSALGLVLLIFGTPAVLVIGLAVLAVGVGLLVTGGVLLGTRLRQRRAIDVQIRALRDANTDLPQMPDLPPMPPPSVSGPLPTLELASF